jgi:hypothetical protein
MGEVVGGGREEVGGVGKVKGLKLKVERTALVATAWEGGGFIAEGKI